MNADLVIGRDGEVVIPAPARRELGLKVGDVLHLSVSGSQLILQRPRDAVQELRALARDVPRSRSLVDELLAERRGSVGAG